MSSIKVRSLCIGDLGRVSAIESKLTGTTRKAFYEKHLALVSANPAGFITCAADSDGKLMGFGIARIQVGDFGLKNTVAVLEVIGVDTDSQRKGIGKAILSHIEQQMKEKNIDALKTNVMWTNSALSAFFSSSGFKLASSQRMERDTSALKENVAVMRTVIMDSKWQVHSAPDCNPYERLSRDRVFVRSFKAEDLSSIIRIDGKLTGRNRTAYFEDKSTEVLDESGIRISLVAEDDGIVSGFIMARVDFGEFGKIDREAVIDTIGVHPAYKGTGIGHALMSQLLLNLSTLKVESVRTQLLWENFGLQRFLYRCGFCPSQRLVLAKTL